jgi:predicted AAA+ superfamily ATPase
MSAESNAYPPLLQTATSPKNLTPAIIGIYGVSGCGKSYLSEQLKKQLGETAFSFHEGSEQLMKTSNNTLANFRRLPEDGKNLIRASTIESISRDCVKTGKAGIVT